jgi:hypothetical protein
MHRLPQDSIPDSDMDPRSNDPAPGQPPVPHDADDHALDVEHDLGDLPKR